MIDACFPLVVAQTATLVRAFHFEDPGSLGSIWCLGLQIRGSKVKSYFLNQAQQTDRQEDQTFGVGEPADPLPDDLANAQKRLQRLQQAKAELEQEAKSQLQAANDALPPPEGRSS